MNFETGVVDQFFGFDGIGALEAHNDRDVNVSNVFVGIHNSLGHAVATHDTTKNIDENGFYFRIFQNDAKSSFHPFGVSRTAYVEEVGRLTPRKFDDVHRRHRKAGTVDHTAHVSVELHVVQTSFTGFHFCGIFFRKVAHGGIFLVAKKCISVEGHFGIHRDDAVVGRF